MAASLARFQDVLAVLTADLRTQIVDEYKLPPHIWDWVAKSITHNAVGGKLHRGLSVVDTAQLLVVRELTADEYFHAAALGWMVELLQAMMLVIDDMMDASTTRRGRPCWYRVPRVGMVAANDAVVLESAIYVLLQKHFCTHAAYVDMVQLFHDTALRVELGQTYDMLTAPPAGVGTTAADLDRFRPDTYRSIVTYKTSYYSFYLPVALALLYVGRATPRNRAQTERILVPMGAYFQAQDDYLDVFADPAVLGKAGTDIVDGKCSWLVVEALQRCTAEQRAVLAANYGRPDAACEQRVRELYELLGLPRAYREYEEAQVAELTRMIEGVDESDGLCRGVFVAFLGKIRRRGI